MNRIDQLSAPLLVCWQLTRDCDLACLHCCTDSAPGKRLPDELDAAEAIRLAGDIAAQGVPYVMLCGGEPMVVPHFFALAETLGRAGVQLKIETNGQRFDAASARRLAALPIRSIQVSLDGDTQEVYERQRPGASLARAHAACRAAHDAGLPLEITFAPSRLNVDEAERVIERALALGAFRFNTGALMRIGTAARQWHRLEPSPSQYEGFRAMLDRQSRSLAGKLELCYEPFTVSDGLRASLAVPPATLLVLPNGWVKVAAALPQICADLRRQTLSQAWEAYRSAWRGDTVAGLVQGAVTDPLRHAQANTWQSLVVVPF
ncbi:MAG TPA: radical SAM protein [Casimicrobiaceae bacterium]|nr:radical SAM protein [Casimicrobiaceae bacterium]